MLAQALPVFLTLLLAGVGRSSRRQGETEHGIKENSRVSLAILIQIT